MNSGAPRRPADGVTHLLTNRRGLFAAAIVRQKCVDAALLGEKGIE